MDTGTPGVGLAAAPAGREGGGRPGYMSGGVGLHGVWACLYAGGAAYPKSGQQSLDLGEDEVEDETTVTDGRYIYRAIATNRDELTDSELVHWYNQRGDDSENRIKELKLDFAGERLPCGQFEANALYFHLCLTAYNLFFVPSLITTPMAYLPGVRWRLYALAAKVVCHARRVL